MEKSPLSKKMNFNYFVLISGVSYSIQFKEDNVVKLVKNPNIRVADKENAD